MKTVKVSLAITTLNEERTITSLLDSISNQSILPNETIIIDAGSTDKTTQLITNHPLKVKLVVKKGISRSKARNLGVKLAKNRVIVMTDAGCRAKKTWLKNITQPILKSKKEVVAGFYDMVSINKLQKIMSIFLGVLPNDFDKNFLPSTRSLAFTKKAWKTVGGFDEKLSSTAEDSQFAQKLVENNIPIHTVKNARVEWVMPESLLAFFNKIYSYAKGDAQTKTFWNPAKGIASHNIKVLFVIARYMFWSLLFILSFVSPLAMVTLAITFSSYIIYIFIKIFKKTREVVTAFLGIPVHLGVDIAVSTGFFVGYLVK